MEKKLKKNYNNEKAVLLQGDRAMMQPLI